METDHFRGNSHFRQFIGRNQCVGHHVARAQQCDIRSLPDNDGFANPERGRLSVDCRFTLFPDPNIGRAVILKHGSQCQPQFRDIAGRENPHTRKSAQYCHVL